MSQKKKYLYIKYTTDKYELPVAIADSAARLAEMIGLKESSVRSMISRGQRGYKKIILDDEE